MKEISNLPAPPTDADRVLAQAALAGLEKLVPRQGTWDLEWTYDNGLQRFIEIPEVASALFIEALKHTAADSRVSLVATGEELTMQQAAAILKISRPLVVSLVEDGHLAARNVGNRHRLPLKDVLEYKAANGPKRRAPPMTATP